MTETQGAHGTAAGPVEIVPAVASDVSRAAATLAAAFSVDPHVVGLLPRGDVGQPLTTLWERIVRENINAGGNAYLAATAGRAEPLGVALWEAPGSRVTLPVMAPGLVDYLRVFRHRFLDATATECLAHRAHPRAPHWYLKAVGTLPGAQGTGVGAGLIRERLVEVDRQRMGAYLEASTEDLVPYYERFGFRSRGPIPCRGTVSAVGMWRPPVS